VLVVYEQHAPPRVCIAKRDTTRKAGTTVGDATHAPSLEERLVG
jgi:hypothetical protein